jgi:hypothetical protein
MATICRRCRAPITGELSTLRPVSGPLFRRHREIQICSDCSDAFNNWLRAAELHEALNVGATLDREPFHA